LFSVFFLFLDPLADFAPWLYLCYMIVMFN
jgi:hypothetical protein